MSGVSQTLKSRPHVQVEAWKFIILSPGQLD
jgi:hypothetical protein